MLRGRDEPFRSHVSQLMLAFTFITPMSFEHSMTRAYVRLLGPCFKTGRIGDRLSHRVMIVRSTASAYPARTSVTRETPLQWAPTCDVIATKHTTRRHEFEMNRS